jgi:hypothetical protein
VERGTIMPAEWGGTAAAAALRRSGPAVIVDGATGDRCFLDDATVTPVPALRPGGTVIPCNLRGPAGLPDCARGSRERCASDGPAALPPYSPAFGTIAQAFAAFYLAGVT